MRSFSSCHIACNQQRFGGLRYPRSLSNTRLTDALLRLRPLKAPPKTAWAPTPLAYRGPVSLLAKLLRIYRNISAEETLGLRARRLGCTFSDGVKRPSALALERQLRCDPSHAGVMPYGPAESWLPRLSAAPYPPARRLRRLDSLALCCDDVNTFSPEHGICQIKLFRWSQRPMRQNEAGPARTARSGSSLCARGKPK